MIPARTTCDLHLHSSASAANDEWYSINFGCPESYATPREQYELCKARGMSLVTLTDHDTIDGGLELVHHGDFFLSEEISTAFPDDDCAIHVLAWNITRDQHARFQAARGNAFELVDLLRQERVAHACAHPLFSPNWKLSVAALEKILVLFPILEGVNGLTDRALERDLRGLLARLDRPALERIAARHGIPLVGDTRVIAAGSDDHALRHAASCFTETGGVHDPAGLLAALGRGEARVHGHGAELDVMCLTASRVTYGFLSARKQERADYRDPFVDLIDVVAGRTPDVTPGLRAELVRSLRTAAATHADPFALEPHGDLADRAAMDAIRTAHDRLLAGGFRELSDGISDLDMYRVLGALRDLAGAATTAIPLLFAADHFARQRTQAAGVLAAWHASPRPERAPRLALFSDTLDHVDGVTSSLVRFAARAAREGRAVCIPYCGAAPPPGFADGVCQPLPAAASHEAKLYSTVQIHLPSLLGTIDWLSRHEITHVELATPGPMGLVALAAARLLRLPVTASYHTELPELLRHLSPSALLHRAALAYARWFYGAVDRVFVFSDASRRRMLELGVPEAKLERVPVVIDPDEFSPAHACPQVFPSLGVRAERIVLTVGRLSREKNLPLVIEAVGRLGGAAHLVVVGDGPERASLEAASADKPYVTFVGLQHGEVLRRLYATASAFVFASQIDTLGLATMEAMASGAPVIVPHGTAISELVEHGITGYCYEHGVDGLASALSDALACPVRRAEIAANARQAMVDRWAKVRFADTWHAMAGG